MNAVNRDALQVQVTEADHGLEDQLYLAASALAAEAQQVDDPQLIQLLLQTSTRIVAVARVYARLQTMDLQNQADIAGLLPDLCEELHACFDGARALPDERGDELRLPATRALPPRTSELLRPLVADEAAQAAFQERRSVCVQVEHDHRGGRYVTIGDPRRAVPDENVASDVLRSLTQKLAHSLRIGRVERGAVISVRFG